MKQKSRGLYRTHIKETKQKTREERFLQLANENSVWVLFGGALMALSFIIWCQMLS